MRTSFIPLLVMVVLAVPAHAESVPVFTADGEVNPMALALPAGSTARLDLPDGRGYEVSVLTPHQHQSGNTTWRAALAGVDHPGYVITVTGDATTGLFGTIVTPEGSYRVSPGTGSWNAVRLSRESVTPYANSFDVVPVRPDKVRLPTAPSRVAEDHAQKTVINVMFRYTASARDGMEHAAWQAHLDNLIATVNTAYDQSGTLIEFVRVGDDSVTIDESADNTTALELFKVDVFGAPRLEDLRLNRDAHLVTLLRGWQPAHGTCGAAHLPVCGDDEDCYDAALGFSAVSLRGSCTTLELAHQWGHNLGSAHEPADGQLGTYGYSHGHVTSGDVGTIMAVGGGNRAAYFSAPGITQCGGQACGVTDVSDNARSLERTRHFISRWTTDRSIAFADPDPRLLRNETTTLALDRFGVVGVTYDVDLIRNGTVVEALFRARPFVEDEMSVTLSPTVQPGAGYVVQVRSTSRPAVSFDLPVTVDEPPPAAELAFAEATVQASGNGGGVTLTVERGGSSDGEVRVDYETLGGSAAGNFTPTSGTLVWPAGDTGAKSFTVENVRSAESGQVTTIFVVLRNPSDGARLGTPSQAEIRVAGQAGGGGGGGSFGAGMLVALAAFWMLARRRRLAV